MRLKTNKRVETNFWCEKKYCKTEKGRFGSKNKWENGEKRRMKRNWEIKDGYTSEEKYKRED
jgi:hypothetical protein